MFGDLPTRVKQAYDDLCAKKTIAMESPDTSSFEAASDAWEHWHHISGIEEQFFYQKSRIQWMGMWDRNTRFYHKVCQSRSAKNSIRKLVGEDGRILTEQNDIKQAAAAYYENFLNDQTPVGEEVSQSDIEELLDFRCSNADAAALVSQVSGEEIRKVLFSMPSN